MHDDVSKGGRLDMYHYVIAKLADDDVELVVRYSSPPPARVVDAWTAQGLRMVRIPGPQEGLKSREIAQAPPEWRVLEKEVVRR